MGFFTKKEVPVFYYVFQFYENWDVKTDHVDDLLLVEVVAPNYAEAEKLAKSAIEGSTPKKSFRLSTVTQFSLGALLRAKDEVTEAVKLA